MLKSYYLKGNVILQLSEVETLFKIINKYIKCLL